jgi:hypothetical protein
VLRRLTATEYSQTVRDLLGVDSNPGQAFPVEGKDARYDFDNAADGQLASDLLAEALVRVAEELAAAVRLERLSSCLGAATFDDGCVARFIADFGKGAFRRPLQPWETAQAQALHARARTLTGDARLAVRALVQFFLQAPQLLYRIELVTPNEAARGPAIALSPHELATRLSYFLWGTTPDASLMTAADAGQLATPDQIGAQARRMLGTARGRAMLVDFHWQWLELDGMVRGQALAKDAALYKGFDATAQSALVSETQLFVQGVFDGGGTLADLLAAPWSLMNAPLVAYYGVAPRAGAPAAAFTRVDLDPARAVGVLTHGALLAQHAGMQETSPIRRGQLVRKRLLCQELHVPEDPAIDTNPRPRRPGTTVRQWLTEAHSAASPACSACHALIDPVGLGFERFDAVGRWRDSEILPNDKLQILPTGRRAAVSDAGDLVAAGEVSGRFQGVRELGDRLARSAEARACVVRQWFRYAQGRRETEAEECAIADLARGLAASGGVLRDLLVALTQSDPFRYRTPASP